VIAALLRDPSFAIDTSVGRSPAVTRACARSTTSTRLSYSHPIVVGDTGSISFIATQLDAKGLIDSAIYEIRLNHSATGWFGSGLNVDREVFAAHVHPEGCIAFTHPLFPDKDDKRLRIDTVVFQLDDSVVGTDIGQYPLRRIRPGPEAIGLGSSGGRSDGAWYVRHDTVYIRWSTGMDMLLVEAKMTGDSLAGTLTYGTDNIIPNPPTVILTGRRVSCRGRIKGRS
jgi:hypothetical protein